MRTIYPKKQKRHITSQVKKEYKLYAFLSKIHFGCEIGGQKKKWAPQVSCGSCESGLKKWMLNAKIKEGIFVGPQIRKLVINSKFDTALTGVEKVAWSVFRDVVCNFLGNYRASNYVELVNRLLAAY